MRDFGLDHEPPKPPADDRPAMPELKIRSLDEISLMEEVLEQLAHAKRLRDYIATDYETPANQKAQVNNSCASLIAHLAKTQIDLYSAERMKKMEACLIKCLRTLPDGVVAEFLKLYQAELANAG